MSAVTPAAPPVRIREITSRTDAALASAYELLRATFARHERINLGEWRAVLREREAEVWIDFAWHLIVAERQGEVLGLVTGTFIGSVGVAVIGYLAISPTIRGGGLGTRLRERLRTEFSRDAQRLDMPLDAIMGEVSRVNPWLQSLARRPQMLVLDLPYYQPSLHFFDRSSAFVLYYESTGRPRASLPMLELRRILYAIWRQAYRLPRPLERRAFRRMLRALERRRHVGRHPDFFPSFEQR